MRRRRLPSHLRRFTAALLVCGVGGGLMALIWPSTSGLFLFGLYSMPSNSMLPIPHEPGLLYVARYYAPLWIAVAGCAGSAVAAFADYEIVERALRLPKLAGARESGIYKWSVKWLMRYPFATIALFAATPLPIYVVRVLAPASGYSVWRYVAAIVVGRFPRFLVLAWIGHLFEIPIWVLVLLFAIFIAFLWHSSWSSKRRESEEVDEEFAAEIDDDVERLRQSHQ